MDAEAEEDLKILFITESFPPDSHGGGEISCALLAEGLAEKGLHISVLTSRVKGLKKEEEKNGVKILRRLKTGEGRDTLKENLKRKMFFKKSVKKEVSKLSQDHDIIHFFNITSITDLPLEKTTFATINSYINFCPKGNLFYKEKMVCEGCDLTKFIGCLTNSEYVGNHKMSNMLRYNPFFWIALYIDYKKRKKCLDHVDHFFSLSDFISKLLVEAGVSEKNILKVPNVPKIEVHREKKKFDIPKGEPLVTYIGALTKIKGVDLLIKAFNELDTDAKLMIVGDGPERKNLERMSAKNENITLSGKIDHKYISSIYKRSDVVVVPSVWPEPLSRVLLESAYFGVPIIATDVGGSPEVVKHGFNGLLVEPNSRDLKEKLESLIENDERRDVFAHNMKKYFKNNLSKENVLKKGIRSYYRASKKTT